MGILNSTMAPIDKAKHYLEQFKDLKDRLDQITNKLAAMRDSSDVDANEYERLYEKEFEISITLYGLYEDIQKILDYAKTNDNEFIIRRLKKEADTIFKPIIVEV